MTTATQRAVPPAATPLRPVGETWLVALVVFLASTRLIARFAWSGELFGADSPLLYQAGTLGFNYPQFGAVRRGLGGTLTWLLGHDLLHATVRFHLGWAALVALGVAALYRRLDAPAPVRWAFVLVAVAIMLRWAEDAGRTDMAVVALFAFATLAVQRGRLDLAVAGIGVGLFVHESSMIFGLPLLAGLLLARGRDAAPDRRMVLRAGAVLAASLAGYLLLGLLPHASDATMVGTIRAELPRSEIVDWALYFALGGMRGVVTSICQNRHDPSYLIHPVGGLVVLLAVGAALAWRVRDDAPALALAALPGFVFLCIVANDIARWTMFAAFNLWLVAVSVPRTRARRNLTPWLSVAVAAAVIPLVHPKPDKIEFPIYAGSPLVEWVARRLHGPRTPSVQEALAACDPHWREVLGDRVAR